jgi:ABC-type glycerol-3-phosphate transport system permease component
MAKHKKSLGSCLFDVINYFVLILFALICIYPFYYMLVYSLSASSSVQNASFLIFPIDFTVVTYKNLFMQSDIYHAAFISGVRAVVGTVITVFCCSLLAYLLTQKRLRFRKFFYRFVIITMYINAGLIPWYMTMKMLGLKNNFLLYVLPSAINAFFVILLKTYIEQIPESLEESAMIDGAGPLTIFFRIMLPLSKPIVATIAIFSAVNQWNAWTDNYFLASTRSLTTLQLLLYNYFNASAQATNMANAISGSTVSVTPMTVKMAISMITVIPILIVYPIMQKYFAKGIMLGAVKG